MRSEKLIMLIEIIKIKLDTLEHLERLLLA